MKLRYVLKINFWNPYEGGMIAMYYTENPSYSDNVTINILEAKQFLLKSYVDNQMKEIKKDKPDMINYVFQIEEIYI